MDIGKVIIPKRPKGTLADRGHETEPPPQAKTENEGTLLPTPDSISISGDARGLGKVVDAQIQRLRFLEAQEDPASRARVEEARRMLDSGRLDASEVLKETADRILADIDFLP